MTAFYCRIIQLRKKFVCGNQNYLTYLQNVVLKIEVDNPSRYSDTHFFPLTYVLTFLKIVNFRIYEYLSVYHILFILCFTLIPSKRTHLNLYIYIYRESYIHIIKSKSQIHTIIQLQREESREGDGDGGLGTGVDSGGAFCAAKSGAALPVAGAEQGGGIW